MNFFGKLLSIGAVATAAIYGIHKLVNYAYDKISNKYVSFTDDDFTVTDCDDDDETSHSMD